jgi:hypothetical protein
VESAFKAEVDVEYSGVAFSAEFDATYAAQTRDDSSSTFGLADIVVPESLVALTNTAVQNRSEGFNADPDVSQLPDVFNEATRPQFFRVLAKYGTHFVSGITFGGRLRAVSYSDDVAHFSQQDATASMAAEYDGLFSTISASGSASWERVEQSWMASRSFYMTALGGDPSLVPLGDHAYDATYDPSAWIKSVSEAPTGATFRLQPLSEVFTGLTQTAMDEAIGAFLDTAVQLTINTDQLRTYATVGTTRIPAPAPTPGPEEGVWLWVLLLNRNDSSIVLNTRFSTPTNGQDLPAQVDTAVTAALSPNPDLVVAFGGYWPWGVRSMIPQSLEALAEINGFELSSISQSSGIFNFGYVGSTSRHDGYAATSSDMNTRCSNTVNLHCNPLAVVDQSGYLR